MLKAVIVDDEQKSRESLRILLEDFCKNVDVVSLCATVDEGVEAIEKHKPDIIFLDIQISKQTGFDLLRKFKKIEFEIIFITAYSEYAIDAIKFSALDYLLKPIDIQELKNAVNKVEKKMLNGSFKDQFEALLHNFKIDNSESFKIGIPSTDGLVFINIKEILYCEALSNYTKINLKEGKTFVVSKTLKEYESMLQNHHFYRIHNSYIINTNEIKKYIRGDGGQVILSNNVSLDVSKRKKEGFLSKMEGKN